MIKEPNKSTYKKILVYIFFTLILSQILTALTGHTIVDPILVKFGIKNVFLYPLNYPIEKQG